MFVPIKKKMEEKKWEEKQRPLHLEHPLPPMRDPKPEEKTENEVDRGVWTIDI